MKIGIVDYGAGNIGSVLRALEELDCLPTLLSSPDEIDGFPAIILPGVGSFSEASQQLYDRGWADAIRYQVLELNKPLLGICLGMQLLATFGNEGTESAEQKNSPGLDLIPGRVEHLKTLKCEERIPHIGWNSVKPKCSKSGTFKYIPDGTDFYFVHSYAFVAAQESHVSATTQYGIEVTASVQSNHIWGTQFHPEKSSKAGFQMLKNFIEIS